MIPIYIQKFLIELFLINQLLLSLLSFKNQLTSILAFRTYSLLPYFTMKASKLTRNITLL